LKPGNAPAVPVQAAPKPNGNAASATPATPSSAPLDKPAVAPVGTVPIKFTANVSGDLTYGSCVVNFPVLTHKKGELEEPDWWQPQDLSKDFAVDRTSVLGKSAFLKGVGAGDVLLLVHGFNTSFDDCVLRVAQLQYDLEFPGAAVAFSWPSAASISGYQQDADSAGKSTTALAELLRTLIDRNAATTLPDGRHPKLHIVAHSMGNRILLNALYALDDAGYFKPDSKPLGQVILAAPDVGAQMFNNLIPYATDYAEQVTYYYCDNDTALAASRTINYYEPVGLLPVFEDGLRTICADGTDTSFIGHGYYASSPRVLLDMQLQITAGLDPDHRMPPLATRNKVFGHLHWSFTPATVVAVDAKP
jgi:esterase/lipase superfamily enzyme